MRRGRPAPPPGARVRRRPERARPGALGGQEQPAPGGRSDLRRARRPTPASRKALAMSPAEVIRARQDRAPARPRRRRLPDRHEVGVHARRRGRPALRHLQRRRGRAGHLQGPRHPDRVPRPAVRGHDDRRLRHRRAAGASSTCAASTPTCASTSRTCSPSGAPTGLLGESICGKPGFDFDIRIQMGAGAYVCGEETALTQLVRGPARRPQEPAAVPGPDAATWACPPSVNNVETLCCVAAHPRDGRRLVRRDRLEQEHGHQAPQRLGRLHAAAASTRCRSAPGWRRCSRCAAPRRRQAVQVGGPSGQMVGAADFDRTICFDDLATGGALMVFGAGRDLLEIASRVHGVLRRRELRLLHALPGRQRACSRSGSTGSSPAAASRPTSTTCEELARDDEDHEPLRPRPDLAQPGASTLSELPPALRSAPRLRRPGRLPERLRPRHPRLAEAGRLAGRSPVDLEAGGEPR